MKTAVITGISGQDGAYLSKLLLDKGYKVIGTTRSYTSKATERLKYLGMESEVLMEEADLTDFSSVMRLFYRHKPDELYNLAAQSSVGLSFEQPIGTFSFNTLSALNIFEAARLQNSHVRIYQASSSEMYGRVTQLPVREGTPMYPVSPYAVSKAAAHWMAVNYRESFDLFIGIGILFNHESFLRSDNFFVKKVIKQGIEIKRGKRHELRVGDLDIKRDFGYAPAYVEGIWRILQHNKGEDFVICSGQSISLREITDYVFGTLGLDRELIVSDPGLKRPDEIENIYGDSRKARALLGWSYNTPFRQILDILIEEQLGNDSVA